LAANNSRLDFSDTFKRGGTFFTFVVKLPFLVAMLTKIVTID
jgi:hypothetical protein